MNVKTTLVVFAILIVVTGAVSRIIQKYNSINILENSAVLSEQSAIEIGTGKNEENVQEDEKDNTEMDDQTSQTSKLPDIPKDATLLQLFIYPNSEIVERSNNFIELNSQDDTGKITNWYKDIINGLDFRVTSFVTTNSNNNILNKLTAMKDGEVIEIEISKPSISSTTRIKIGL